MAPIDARKKLEQIKRSKNKNQVAKVRDLRQLITKKKKIKGNDRTTSQVSGDRVTKTNSYRDLRDTNRKLASRKIYTTTRDDRVAQGSERANQGPSRSTTSINYNTRRLANNGKPFKAGKRMQQQYYVPPQMQHQQPTYIIAPASVPQSNLAMDNVPEAQGASVLVSNLSPTISQSDIIEVFGDIGAMTAVNMINQTTALVTYQHSSDAVRAVQVYHNREFDGQPMLVNMMPNATPASNVRSRVGHVSMVGGHQTQMEMSYSGRRI